MPLLPGKPQQVIADAIFGTEENYEFLDAEKMGLTEAELIQIIRNGFAYSISGQHLLPQFDAWVERFQQEGAQ